MGECRRALPYEVALEGERPPAEEPPQFREMVLRFAGELGSLVGAVMQELQALRAAEQEDREHIARLAAQLRELARPRAGPEEPFWR